MTQLFVSDHVRLDAPDPEKDAAVEAAWTHDAEFLRLTDFNPARPLASAQVKKKYEQMEKDANRNYSFALRLRDLPTDGPEGPGRLIGFARLDWIDWYHGAGNLSLGIAAPADRGQGYGSETMDLLERYAFDECSLHRLSAQVPEYNPGAIRFFERRGFTLEVRRRQALARDGRRWDVMQYGLLREEWKERL
jgi:RimJ/RimL family protein N-acetyltransferase